MPDRKEQILCDFTSTRPWEESGLWRWKAEWWPPGAGWVPAPDEDRVSIWEGDSPGGSGGSGAQPRECPVSLCCRPAHGGDGRVHTAHSLLQLKQPRGVEKPTASLIVQDRGARLGPRGMAMRRGWVHLAPWRGPCRTVMASPSSLCSCPPRGPTTTSGQVTTTPAPLGTKRVRPGCSRWVASGLTAPFCSVHPVYVGIVLRGQEGP